MQLGFDLVSDEAVDFIGSRARPGGTHDHDAESEGRVFRLAEVKIGPHPDGAEQHHEIGDQRTIAQRPSAQIKAGHGRANLQCGFGGAVDGLYRHAGTEAMHTGADQPVLN